MASSVHIPTVELPPHRDVDRFAQYKDLDIERDDQRSWQHTSGILVDKSIAAYDLEDFDPDPLKTDMPNVGNVRLVGLRRSRSSMNPELKRVHRLYSIDVDDYRHAVEVTDPLGNEPAFTVFSFPGFTETIEGPFRKELHRELAEQFPEARIVSVGSNGVGTTGGKYNWNERSFHDTRAMGSQRLILSKALAGDMGVYWMGTSMGSVIAVKGSHENLHNTPNDKAINQLGLFALSQAIVDPRNVPRDMALRFVPGLIIKDIPLELALKTPPREALMLARQGLHYGLGKKDIHAMANQVMDLLHGVPEHFTAEVISNVPIALVAGEHDPLAQWKMWDRLSSQHPGMIEQYKVPSRGHEIAMKPHRACAKMAAAGRLLVERTLPRAA